MGKVHLLILAEQCCEAPHEAAAKIKMMKYYFMWFVIQLQNSLPPATGDLSFKWLPGEMSSFREERSARTC